MKKILLAVIICSVMYSYADEIEFTEKIYEKPVVNFSDGVEMFCYMFGIPVNNSFDKNMENLSKQVKYMPKKYSAEKPFTVGDFSLFAMQYLDIKSGLFYLASHSGRYAARELMLRNIIPFNTSEYEKISGQELIALVQKVVEYEESK